MTSTTTEKRSRKPRWLRRKLPSGPEYERVRGLIRQGRLHTVCQEAACPNQFECFSSRTATFLIMGDRCTRNCRFCNVDFGPQAPLDPEEPERVAAAAAALGLRYVVVTSVTRDDLPDGGAAHFAATIAALHQAIAGVKVEVLIPDLQGDAQALETVIAAKPQVLNHNVETVPRLYASVRPQASYQRSLTLLTRVARHPAGIPAKSGLMLGLGETRDEIEATIADIHATGCRILTLGQYLQPTKAHLPVARYVPPETFAELGAHAEALGFDQVASGPFVRSSYHAREVFEQMAPDANRTAGCHPPPAPD
ncbi:MAG: lipoyl synthase [Desulfosarcinaceae bacterium]|nr:lipoyl synthase [Desulfosarcinaceae bacterium]